MRRTRQIALGRFTLRNLDSTPPEAPLTRTEPVSHPAPVPPADREDVSVFDLLTPLVRRRRLIFVTAVGCALLTAIV